MTAILKYAGWIPGRNSYWQEMFQMEHLDSKVGDSYLLEAFEWGQARRPTAEAGCIVI